MLIHVVQTNETINSIADKYGVSVTRLVQENDLTNPDNLVVGQSILIVYPEKTYTVKVDDTLVDIANDNGVTVMQMLRNNPYLLDREALYPGETLVVSYGDEKIRDITTNGYVYPFVNKAILRKNLLYLTYLSIFSYTLKPNGEINDIDDNDIIHLAKFYGVAPIMVLSNISQEGTIDKEVLHNILISQNMKNNLIDNIFKILKTKGYYGINIDTPYVLEEDRELYIEFISLITESFNKEGYKVFVTITPDSFKSDTGYNETIDFSTLGNIANGITLISYSWGYSESSIGGVPLYLQETLLEFMLRQIPPEKTSIGITNIGYIMGLPFEAGVTRASSISVANAYLLASNVDAKINFNNVNLLSYFYIMNPDNYYVYFHDIRAIEALFNLVTKYDLDGVDIWNAMNFLPQACLLLNTQFRILKVI